MGNLRFKGFQVFANPIYSVQFGPIALPKASTRCQQSLNLVSGFYCEGGENKSCLSQVSGRMPWAQSGARPWELAAFLFISKDKGIVRLKHYWRFMLRFMFLQTVITFLTLSELSDRALSIWITGLNARTKRKYLDINDGLYQTNIYCGTGIPGSAFWWRSKVSEYL